MGASARNSCGSTFCSYQLDDEISAEECGAAGIERRSISAVPAAYAMGRAGPTFGTIEALLAPVIDPPVTPEERLADAISAFGLLCDRAIESLDLLGWENTLDAEPPTATS